MKQILMACVLVLLTACAGEPPKWWNPTDKYTAPKQEAKTQKEQVAPKPAPAPKKEEVIGDEFIAVEDTSLEEVEFQPLEDNPIPEENADGENTAVGGETDTANQTLLPSILAEEEPVIQDKQPELSGDTDEDE
jgi:hypothetical protein